MISIRNASRHPRGLSRCIASMFSLRLILIHYMCPEAPLHNIIIMMRERQHSSALVVVKYCDTAHVVKIQNDNAALMRF